MTLAGYPARAPRQALLVGSNPAVTRVLRTYLEREGVRCREATPEQVMRASSAGAPAAGAGDMHGNPVAVVVVVASLGTDLAGVRAALGALPATADAPVLVVESLAGGGLRPRGADGGPPTVAWPFRLRDVMDAIAATVAAHGLPPVAAARGDARGSAALASSECRAPDAVRGIRAAAPVPVGASRP